MGLRRFKGALPPTTDHWDKITGLHDTLSFHAETEALVRGPDDELVWGRAMPGVRRTWWDIPDAQGAMPWDNKPYWRAVTLPGLRAGVIDIVDSSRPSGPLMTTVSELMQGEESDATNPAAAESEGLMYTTNRYLYFVGKLGGFLVTRSRLVDVGSPDDEPLHPARALWNYAEGQVTGYQPATVGDHVDLLAHMEQGVAAKNPGSDQI